MMIGSILGDMVGSRFEFDNLKSTKFEFLTNACEFTDDTVMTLAVARALMDADECGSAFADELVSAMQELGRMHPNAGYGGRFYDWLFSENPRPYNSWGNGSAMRVSPVGWAFDTLEQTEHMAAESARVTHNHPEGIKGAQATAAAMFLARTGSGKDEIKTYIERTYGYDLDRTLDGIRPGYSFDVSCQGSVPEAIIAFLESDGYEDAIRKAVSLGGDSDTIGAICGGIAQAYYGVPQELADEAYRRLTPDLQAIYDRWQERLQGAKS